ncbi:MAG: penicillin-binding protein 2 [Patescibacteria group bacterium]|nr:penicillin-binding protein 2 [Patescibacteria group bacterium]
MSKQSWSNYKKQDKRYISSLFSSRLRLLKILFIILAVVIGAKLFILQALEHSFYAALASDQHEIYKNLFPERGTIYAGDELSENKYIIATNEELNLLYADSRNIDNPEEVLNGLQGILQFSDEEKTKLAARLSDKSDPYEPIQHGLTDDVAQKIKDLNFQGIAFIKESTRFYPENGLGGHLIGFVGSDEGGERSGKYGVEGYFDRELAGEPGFLHSVLDATGSWITVADRSFKPAVDGDDIYLTIDRNIQYQACSRLKAAVEKHGADGGSIIVMRPDGKILAMCSAPDFDSGKYNEVEDITTFNNSAIFNSYEPGSVFKAITMAAALDQDKVTPKSTYEDAGEIKYGDHVIKNSDEQAHGIQTMTQVLELSLNTGAIYAMEQIGKDKFQEYVKNFGFGQMTEIELETEQAGDISSLDKRGDIFAATASFGQGITATPLQVATAFAAIANGGKLVKPYVIDKIVSPDGSETISEPKVVEQVISARTATLLSGMLVSVVENGHGQRAGVSGYYVAGKTGTAQVPRSDGQPGYDPNITIGTFAGFAPAQNPAFVMLVKIDHPRDVQWAESSAAPLFGEMAKFLLNYLEVPSER